MRSVIDLSPGFSVEENVLDIRSFTFSGGEVHVVIEDFLSSSSVRINARCNNSDDFMRIAMIVDALRGVGASNIELFMPYLPYARQDRRMVYGEPHSLKVFGSMLNALKLSAVYVYDVHSDVANGIIDNLHCIDNVVTVNDYACMLGQYTLVCPDAGAYKKIYKLAPFLGYKGEIVIANKVRDVTNGRILRTDVYGDVSGKNCLIVDDICDGGATFLGLAEELKKKGAGDLHLFVSHGIFSKGTESLLSYYKTIATTNSIREYTEGVITYPLYS